MKVLVTDAEQRSALAVTRSLGRIPAIEVTTVGESATALAGCSRFSHRYLCAPSPETRPEKFIQWVIDLLSEETFDLVIPVTEVSSQLLLLNAQRVPDLKMPFSDHETVVQLADKGKLVDRAKSLNVPVPPTQWYPNTDALSVHKLRFPLVIKPCLSRIYTKGRWVKTRVKLVDSLQDLRCVIETESYLKHHPFLIQAFIPGGGAGVFCLYNKGKATAFFAHKRLREKPPEGGVSVLCESSAVDETMKNYAVKLLDSVAWHGVAMVEFRVTHDGTPYLMEVNTRFWGSLQLAVDSGVDFPWLLWQIEQSSINPEPTSYRTGQRLRWLLGDLDSLYLYLKGTYSLRQKMARLARFLTPSFGSCRHEINRLNDLGPAWHELKLYLVQTLGR